jgi:hypothetical protein
MKRLLTRLFAGALFMSAMAGQSVAAPSETPIGRITFYSGGWTDAIVRVQLQATFQNPDNCGLIDGYVVDPALGGAQLFSSFLLTAFTTDQPVRLVIDGCAYSRPRIIAVTLQK